MNDRDSDLWDVFISYASEDRDVVAEPLALGLRAEGLRVWYDEFELQLGDSLREKIDEGLARSVFGVVILSESFFQKHFPRREFQGLTQREVEGRNVLLPIWHGVTDRRVREFSPPLADRKAVDTTRGIKAIVDLIVRKVRAASLFEADHHKDDPPVKFATVGRSPFRRALDEFSPPSNLRNTLKDW